MLVVKFYGKRKVLVEEIPKPEPKEGEVLIKVRVSALCGSEIGMYLADNPKYIRPGVKVSAPNPGHELTGEVIETNKASSLKVGDRIALHIQNGCGECYYCRKGYPIFCELRKPIYGGHAEYVVAPEKCCIKLPDDISYEAGVLLGGDTIGVAYRIISQLKVRNKIVLVIGAGPIGLGMLCLLKYLGAEVIVSEPSKYRREFAKKQLDADTVLNPLEIDMSSEVRRITSGIGPEIIIECSGNPKMQVEALNLIRCQGIVAYAGENWGEISISPSNHIIHKEIKILGGVYFSINDFPNIVNLYRKGIQPEKVISHRLSLKDAAEGYRLLVEGLSGKILLIQ